MISVEGKAVEGWQDFTKVISHRANQAIPVEFSRKGEIHTVTVTPRLTVSETGESIGFLGLIVKVPPLPANMLIKERVGPITALTQSLQRTQENIVMTFHLLGKMVVGKLGLKHLSGPISIAEGAGLTAVIGLSEYLGFLALISISLGVLNLLPIPVLDGGHLLYFLMEGIIGRPISEKVQLWGFKLGFMFLIFLMVIAFYNDLVRFL